jgi:bifunctional NMN adenylyltransferase/nudix hydrolase
MSKKYDLAVVVGRFQGCVHRGHIKLFKTAQDIANHTLICVGSSGIARNIKNPFTFAERKSMIESIEGTRDFPYAAESNPIMYAAIRDQPYNDTLWIKKIQQAVQNAHVGDNIALVGHKKDDSTYYLDMFPNYEFVGVDPVYLDQSTLDATAVRELLFDKRSLPPIDMVPANVVNWLHDWKADHPKEFETLCEEFKYIKDYKDKWSKSPYQPSFVTTDAVVICSGHILLTKRRLAPGKGLWALPGGFLEPNLTIRVNTVEEITQETRIAVDDKELYAGMRTTRVFDNPNRSLRGRTITHATLIDLGTREELPHVRGSNETERSKWFTIHEFINNMGDKTFEDHWDIGTTLVYS